MGVTRMVYGGAMTTNKNCTVLGPDYLQCCRHGNHDGPHYDGAHTHMWRDDECLELPKVTDKKAYYPRVKRVAKVEEASRLTKREREVLQGLADGLSRPEVAERLFLSPDTVRSHTGRIYRKIGAKTSAEAVAIAIRAEVIA
jgi:DNA-binding CsgD family transcriptional regulator